VADQDEAFETAARAIERQRSALPADPVLHAQLATVQVQTLDKALSHEVTPGTR
jgi:hypothetical protein